MAARPNSRRVDVPVVSGPAGRTVSRGGVWLGALVIVAAGAVAYWGIRDAPLVFDDVPAIVENPTIRDLARLDRVLHPPSEGSGIDSRPVINLSLALNYAAGGLNPRGYHLANIAIHLLGALALFGLLRRTFALPGMPGRLQRAALPAAWGGALLWAVHPLQTETVICIVQRTEALVSLFYLLTLYCFVRAAAPDGSPRWFWPALGACLAGMAAKEVMVTAPLLVLLFDRTFLAGTFREAWRRRGRWHLALASTWILLVALIWSSGGQRGGTAGFGHGFSSWDYLLTQARAITTYLKLSVWPQPLIVDYGTWRARDFREVAPDFAAVAALFALTLVALRRWPRAGFAGAAFFAILAPSSSVYPLVTQTIAEHRMHLPLAAVLVLGVVGAARWLNGRWLVAACGLIAIVAVAGTIRRGGDYASEEKLWTDLIEKDPGNPWAYFNLAKMFFRRGDFARAELLNREVVRLMPANPDMHLAWGLSLEKLGRGPAAAAAYEEALRLKPGQPKVLFRLGMVALRAGRAEAARAAFAAALQLRPDDFDTEGNLGVALLQLGRYAESAPHFERLLAIKPDSVDAHYNLGYALAHGGQPAAAVEHLARAAQLAPGAADIRTALGGALLQLGRTQEARVNLVEAVRLDPNAREARGLLERIPAAP